MNEVQVPTKKCPYCAETVKAEAMKCIHCGEILDVELRTKQLREKHEKKWRPFFWCIGIMTGVAVFVLHDEVMRFGVIIALTIGLIIYYATRPKKEKNYY